MTTTGLDLALAERLLASTHEGMIVFDNDLRCRLWNRRMEELTGVSAELAVGRDVRLALPSLAAPGEEALLRLALAGEELSVRARPYLLDARVPSLPAPRVSQLSPQTRFFDARFVPLDGPGAGQRASGAVLLLRDVSDERRAAEVLGETEARFRNMADVAPVLLWMADPDGLCSFFNQTWLSFTGRTQEEEWGVGWAEGVHFEDFQRCMDTYMDAFCQRRRFEMEYRLRRHDGEYRWLLDRGTPRYTPDGSFAGYIGSCIDITERRAFEEQLRQAVIARDEFLSVASHELKTPLTSLQLQIEALTRQIERRPREGPEDARLQSGGRAVTDQARRLSDLVDVLLDVSHINSGRLRFAYATVDLAEVLRDAVERWRAAAATVRSELSLELEPALSGAWDRLRLDQVLNNLLSNAIKYGPGKPIHIEASGDYARVRFSVRDEGIGIPTADQPRIFQRFERAVPTRNYGGLGLGLWITREIVAGLGGSIAVASAPEQGATFAVELPRARAGGAMRSAAE